MPSFPYQHALFVMSHLFHTMRMQHWYVTYLGMYNACMRHMNVTFVCIYAV
eukprot:COSAG03_NODE_1508_length_3959_cov_27.988601_2_plen_51_part_00